MKLKENEKMALEELKRLINENYQDAEIILYGSKARGDDDTASDIDILILVNEEADRNLKEKINAITYSIELQHDVIFGTIVENRNFWQTPLANAMPFHWNVDREGVVI